MNKSLKILAIVVITFTIYFVLDDLFFNDLRGWLHEIINQLGISHIIAYTVSGIPLVIGAAFIHKADKVIDSFGLNRSFLQGVIFGLLCTLPMLVGYALFFNLNIELTFNTFLISAVSAAFFEELFFRGFLYGQLYRYTKLGFLPSVIIGAFLFAFIHLYQSDELLRLIGIFLTTFLGAGLFSWTYSEWNHNIWVPISLHFFMNFFWMLFSAGDDALGGVYANIFRAVTIISVIGLTIAYKKKRDQKLEINKDTIWIKKEDGSITCASSGTQPRPTPPCL
ncbi:CPBP family intramembrane glutamic endopeptidase [Rhodohalobacter halophilus]|uniref:CPBP family intramembrane glutamic endopeptidase n=1 Tax=Rhodohalobacter halophilus TaxID=1812810 RepID=UPI000A06F181|nr:type II CAAX endopeptidase family protein [Rhodohalobacter halophilus]